MWRDIQLKFLIFFKEFIEKCPILFTIPLNLDMFQKVSQVVCLGKEPSKCVYCLLRLF